MGWRQRGLACPAIKTLLAAPISDGVIRPNIQTVRNSLYDSAFVGICCHSSEVGSNEGKDLVRGGEAAEVALLGSQDEFGVRQEIDSRLRVPQGHDVVGVAVPPPHRRIDGGQPEAPVATEKSGVVDDGLESALGDQDDVVDEHSLHLGVAKYPTVTRRSSHGIGLTGVVRERDMRRYQHGHRSGEWTAQTTQEWGEAAGQFDGAGCE